jgi:hypothetical protein
MTKTQLKALATKIHGLAVKSADGKKTVQKRRLRRSPSFSIKRSKAMLNKRMQALLLKSVD